jgi:hypothetical protein
LKGHYRVQLIANKQHVIEIYMMDFLQRNKNRCKLCTEKFSKNEELVQHAKKVHRQPITRCREHAMEFLHEEDRLHHVQQEKDIYIQYIFAWSSREFTSFHYYI